MTWFRFLIHGKNYLLKWNDGVEMMGFYTTRYVEAKNLEDAEIKVGDVLRNDEKLDSLIIRTHAVEPRFYLDEIHELIGKSPKRGWWPFRRIAHGGFTFYAMNENEEE